MWNSIKADVSQKQVVTVKTSETASLGAAMLSGTALSVFKDLKEASDKMVHMKNRYEPDKMIGKVYDAAYEKYAKLYDALSLLF